MLIVFGVARRLFLKFSVLNFELVDDWEVTLNATLQVPQVLLELINLHLEVDVLLSQPLVVKAHGVQIMIKDVGLVTVFYLRKRLLLRIKVGETCEVLSTVVLSVKIVGHCALSHHFSVQPIEVHLKVVRWRIGRLGQIFIIKLLLCLFLALIIPGSRNL